MFNIGNQRPVELLTYISCIEKELGREAQKNLLPLQPGDVPDTYASVASLQEWADYTPQVTVEEGVSRFIKWYLEYYGN